MTNIHDISDAVWREPFVPIELRLATGEAVGVTHSDAIIMTDSSVVIGIGQGEAKRTVERFRVIGIDHIVSVEPAAM